MDARILVVGAGIGGLAVARTLARAGFTVEVAERQPAWGEEGTGIYLPGNASRALRALGLLQAVMERGARALRQLPEPFQVVSRRYEHGSIILATNRGIASWGEIFNDTTVAAAILDRLLHHGTVLTSTGTATHPPPPRTHRAAPRRSPGRRSGQAMSRARRSPSQRRLSVPVRVSRPSLSRAAWASVSRPRAPRQGETPRG